MVNTSQIGTWYNPYTKQGFSGIRPGPEWVPADPRTGKPLSDIATSNISTPSVSTAPTEQTTQVQQPSYNENSQKTLSSQTSSSSYQYNPETIGAFERTLRLISEYAYDDRRKRELTPETIGFDISNVSPQTFRDIINYFETRRGGEISTMYAATLSSFENAIGRQSSGSSKRTSINQQDEEAQQIQDLQRIVDILSNTNEDEIGKKYDELKRQFLAKYGTSASSDFNAYVGTKSDITKQLGDSTLDWALKGKNLSSYSRQEIKNGIANLFNKGWDAQLIKDYIDQQQVTSKTKNIWKAEVDDYLYYQQPGIQWQFWRGA